MCDIPVTTTSIPKGGHVPAQAKQVSNDFGEKEYAGPCHPSGTHRYFFKFFALKTESIPCRDKWEFLQQIEEHKIGQAEIMAAYTKK